MTGAPLYDVAVIGGGIVGLAAARQLLARGAGRVAVLDREPAVARHQTGHNSGVIHAGLYYTPGSLKAQLCLKGMRMTYDYLDEKGIDYKKVGKLVVAATPDEVGPLKALMGNATANGVPGLRYISDPDGIRDVEPEVVGAAAIHSPHTGIVDWADVARSFADDVQAAGGEILLNRRVTAMSESAGRVTITTADPALPPVHARQVLTCCGAHADRVAKLCGGATAPQIVPVRGDYLRIAAGTLDIRGNIYPVPKRGIPFLGVHFTPLLSSGDIILGPSAVPALSRDGYRATDVSFSDVRALAAYGGFWRLLARHAGYGLSEIAHSAVPALAVRRAQMYVPRLRASHVARAGVARAGVRAQAVSPAGDLVDDFVFERTNGGRVVHTRNAPSPGATSALAISEVVADYLEACS